MRDKHLRANRGHPQAQRTPPPVVRSIRVRNPKTQKVEFARLKMPQNLPRFVKLPDDDSGRIAQALWDSASTSAARLRDTLAQSLGGRNVLALGLDADLDWCARVDVLADVLPEFDAARGEIRRAHPAHE